MNTPLVVTVKQEEWSARSTRKPQLVPSEQKRVLAARILEGRGDKASLALARQLRDVAPFSFDLRVA